MMWNRLQFRQTVIFEDLGGRTRITWRGEFPSAAERNRVIKDYGADKGLAETLARLGDYVGATLKRDQKNDTTVSQTLNSLFSRRSD